MLPLYPYQRVGAEFLAARRFALLADEMGIGKSAQAVGGCDLAGCFRVLVVCPAIMREQWSREFQRFSRYQRKTQQLLTLKDAPELNAELVICSYDYAGTARGRATLSREWDAIILDEGHYLKDQQAARTTAIYGDMCDGTGIIQHAKRVWILTGTPAPNHAGELYPHLKVFGEWKGTQGNFVDYFCHWTPTTYGIRVTGFKRAEELKTILKRVMLRRTKKEVALQLPRLTIGEIFVEAHELDDQFPVLNDLKLLEPKWAPVIDNAIATNNWFFEDEDALASIRRVIGLAKVRATVQYAEDLLASDKDQKVVIFGLHRVVLKYMAEFLRKYGAKIIYGGSNPTRRQGYIDDFQSKAESRVMLCQIKAAGTGITLTAANHLLLMEPSWVPADNEQAIMRVHRIGQTCNTVARYVTLANSFDEMVNNVLRRKTQLLAEIFA